MDLSALPVCSPSWRILTAGARRRRHHREDVHREDQGSGDATITRSSPQGRLGRKDLPALIDTTAHASLLRNLGIDAAALLSDLDEPALPAGAG